MKTETDIICDSCWLRPTVPEEGWGEGQKFGSPNYVTISYLGLLMFIELFEVKKSKRNYYGKVVLDSKH